MTVTEHPIIKGVFIITLEPRKDHRGFFMRTYDDDVFKPYGIHHDWVQEYQNLSVKKNTIRGLHFQLPPYAEAKLVRCIKGATQDVFVDLRKNSATFGKWGTVTLSAENQTMVYIPRGMAHGLCSLEDDTMVICNMDNQYAADHEVQLSYSDPELAIDWKLDGDPIVSAKDASAMHLKEFIHKHGAIA